MDQLAESIKRHEGYRDRIYLDSEGHLTGGWGHHFYVGSRLSVDIAEILLKQDIALATADYMKIALPTRKKLNIARARVIVEMIFNMGLQKVLQFKRMWEAIKVEDFEKASAEMIDSKWAFQVKGRAVEMAEIMRKG